MNACITFPKQPNPYLNEDSFHFHAKMGFHLVGTFHNSGYKFDTWYDMIWMEKLIAPHTEPSPEVRFGEWTIGEADSAQSKTEKEELS